MTADVMQTCPIYNFTEMWLKVYAYMKNSLTT
jgi:hypothetical protein